MARRLLVLIRSALKNLLSDRNFLDLSGFLKITRKKYHENKIVGFFYPYGRHLDASFGDRATAAQARNDPAPSFTLKLLSGKDFDFSELKGKPAVLKFVSSY